MNKTANSSQMWKDGILNANKELLLKGEQNLHRERQQGRDELVVCNRCKGVFGKMQEAEKFFQTLQRRIGKGANQLPKVAAQLPALKAHVMKISLGHDELFESLAEHMLVASPLDNHIVHLIKICCECFVKIRMHHTTKELTRNIFGVRIRNHFNKLVHFSNQ